MAARKQPRLDVPPYGIAIQQAVASGQLRRMKAAAKQAETFLARYGDISAALEALKVEIARLEKSRG
jgi:Domain of unknown function (DUF1843)